MQLECIQVCVDAINVSYSVYRVNFVKTVARLEKIFHINIMRHRATKQLSTNARISSQVFQYLLHDQQIYFENLRVFAFFISHVIYLYIELYK